MVTEGETNLDSEYVTVPGKQGRNAFIHIDIQIEFSFFWWHFLFTDPLSKSSGVIYLSFPPWPNNCFLPLHEERAVQGDTPYSACCDKAFRRGETEQRVSKDAVWRLVPPNGSSARNKVHIKIFGQWTSLWIENQRPDSIQNTGFSVYIFLTLKIPNFIFLINKLAMLDQRFSEKVQRVQCSYAL